MLRIGHDSCNFGLKLLTNVSMKQGMTAQQVNTLNSKLNELRALAVQAQISNILTAQHVADATRTVNRLKGLK